MRFKKITGYDNHFRSLIVAGIGAIGKGVFALGHDTFVSFAEVYAVDKKLLKDEPVLPVRSCRIQGDIADDRWLRSLLDRFKKPAIFINLCAGVDNLKVRKVIAEFDVAYVDSCCCSPEDVGEVRFSRMMPYTLTPVASRKPQWLCWGINPGMVELIARKILGSFPDRQSTYDVTVYEHDQLHCSTDKYIAVGWSPEALIEEVMESPTFAVMNGEQIEGNTGAGSLETMANWQGEPVESRIVGHEDIWNIGLLPEVDSAQFIYGLHPRVMEVFKQDLQTAKNTLQVPDSFVPVYGRERVAVKITQKDTGKEKTLVWSEDHYQIWQRWGVNAVQYQTAKSVLLAVKLLQHTHYGKMNGTFCAADLPINTKDWSVIESCMEDLHIRWHDGDHLHLHFDRHDDTF